MDSEVPSRQQLREMLRQSRPPAALLTFVQEDDAAERQRLEDLHGKENVLNTQEFGERFQLLLCMGPYCVVRDRLMRKDGVIQFQGWPRFFFNYKES